MKAIVYHLSTALLLTGLLGSAFDMIPEIIGIALVAPAALVLAYDQWKGW